MFLLVTRYCTLVHSQKQQLWGMQYYTVISHLHNMILMENQIQLPIGTSRMLKINGRLYQFTNRAHLLCHNLFTNIESVIFKLRIDWQ